MPIMDSLRALQNRIMMIIGRAVLEAVDDSGDLQTLKLSLLRRENRTGVERFQEYGFSSNPLPGAEAVVVFPGGNRDHGLCIAVDDRRFRFKGLKSGEVVLYTDEGDKFHFKRGGVIEVVSATKVEIKSPSVELGSGTIEAILNGSTFRTLYNAHTHLSGAPTTPTGPPVIPAPPTVLSSVVKAET